MFKVGVVLNRNMADSLFTKETLEFLSSFATFNPIEDLPEKVTEEFMLETLRDADAALSCWGTPAFTDSMLNQLPKLRLIAHAAGSIKSLVPVSFWQSGKRITSNAPIIADDVAQTTLALMLTSLKQLWTFSRLTHEGHWSEVQTARMTLRRLDGLNVGLVGASMVAKSLISYLKPFHCNIYVADPYLSPLEADMLEVEKMNLDQMIPICDILSLHAPANADCYHMLNKENIKCLKDNCLLINTARGMLIDEKALIEELQSGRIFACLDVTDPEPPAYDSPLRNLPNVVLTPHRAGGHTANGRILMGNNIINEIYNFLIKGQLKYDIRNEALSHMA